MCHQRIASDSKADTKKEIIMVTALRVALISVVVSLFMAVPPGSTESRQRSTSQLWTSADTDVVPGAKSKLVRRDNEICVRINTKALPEGAYTIWLFAFNNPEHCTAPLAVGGARCGGDADFNNDAVNVSALWATGGIVGPDGVGHFSTCLAENTFPGQELGGPGLTDAQGAEIHLVIRHHCAAKFGSPGLLGAQLTMFGGGCTAEAGGGELGPLGDCDCANLQFAIHPPNTRQHKDE
jgi:hypothetical protein